MCGVFSLVNFDKSTDPTIVDKIYQDIKRRGPDDANLFIFHNLVIGHARLSLVGLGDNGKQPMIDPSSNYVLSFNGEIYNWVELAEKYNIPGCRGDTELLLKLLIAIPMDQVFSEIDGPFAIIFFNKEKNKMVLARDSFGEKPLYFYQDDNQKFACSSNKINLTHKSISFTDLENYFLKLSSEGYCLHEDVRSITPGTYEIFNNYSNSQEDTDHSLFNISKINHHQTNLYEILNESVNLRSRLDEDFCVLLSGGVDSTLTTAMLCEQGFRPKCYTVANDKNDSEFIQASKIADKFKLDLELIKLDSSLLTYFDYYNSQFSPLADTAGLPLFCATKHIKNYYKCAFVGDGADEAFMGYPRYQFAQLLKYFNHNLLKYFFKKFGKKILNLEELNYVQNKIEFLSLVLSKNKSNRHLFNDYSQNSVDPILFMKNFDEKKRLPEYLMLKSDNNSMCHGVELRSIFLNKKLFSYAMNLNFFDNWKYGIINKKPLRSILKKRYNIEVNYKKKGFYVDHFVKLENLMKIIISISNRYPLIKSLVDSQIKSQKYKNDLNYLNALLVTIFFTSENNFKKDVLERINALT